MIGRFIKTNMPTMSVIFLLFLIFNHTVRAQTHDLYGLWVKRAAFGSGGGASIGSSAVDENGNVYVAGSFSGTLNFSDDLCNPKTFTAPHQQGGFVIKFDKDGKYLWAVTSEQSKASGGCTGSSAAIHDYVGGKLLVLFDTRYANSVGMPVSHTVKGPGASNSKTSTLSAQDGTIGVVGVGCGLQWSLTSLQVINCADGKLEATVDPFKSGVHQVVGRIKGDKIFALHWGSSVEYRDLPAVNYQSKVAEYNLSTGVQISNAPYPGQPNAKTTASYSDTRVNAYYALANGKHLVGQASIDDNNNYKRYILLYNANFTAREALVTEPLNNANTHRFSGDASGNVYAAVNYGYGSNNAGVPGAGVESTMSNFFGSGQTFSTAHQKNKAVVCRLAPNLGYGVSSWIFQLGPNSAANQDETIVLSMATEGAHTAITGWFSGNNIDFDPLGGNSAWKLSSAGSSDGFYAVYDNSNGHCVYAAKIGGTNGESIATLSLASGNVILGGTYNSPLLQVDPSERLYPISSNGSNSQGFVALYSKESTSQPTPYNSCFGDAPESYGTAIHHAYACLKIGSLDFGKLQPAPIYSTEADSDENDDGFNPQWSNGFINLAHANHKFNGNNLEIKVKVTNVGSDAAKLMAWLDFDRNGVFDAGEASNAVTVNTGVNNADFTLVWPNANTKIRNGVTYLRIRITTDDIAAGQSAGLSFNGDIEDYKLNFNVLEISKTVSPTAAKVGDVLTYGITVKNNSPVQLTPTEIIDPLPPYTAYVAGSATLSGATANVTVDGQSVNAVKWAPITALAAGASRAYSFKVTVTDAPQLHTPFDSLISNVAYVIANGDSIPSTGSSCNLAETKIIALDAVNDTVKLWAGRASKIDVLANDEFHACTPAVTVANGLHGTATVVNDSILYTPYDLAYEGPDTLKYSIACSMTGNDTAYIYIMLYKLPDNIIDVDGDDCFVPGTSFDFNVKQKWSATSRGHDNTGLLVGDLDGDGIPEIITIGQDLVHLYVTDGATGNLKGTLNIPIASGTGGWHPVMTAVMVDADANGRGEIILATSDGKLTSYEVNPSTFALNVKWGPVSFVNPTTDDRLPQPIVADLDGNGVPELIVYNQIFNAATGVKLGETEAISTAYVGRNPNRTGNKNTNFMTVADFDGDGLPEIAAGGKVYKVSFNASKTSVACSIWRNMSSGIPDGFTAVADVDMDGLLDVVVIYAKADGSTWMGVWSPLDNRTIDNFQIYSNPTYNAQSYPFVGDIDGFVDGVTGKRYPEICVTIVNAVKAYKYNPSTGKYSLKWTLPTTDVSGGTGITLFDFNNDGINELVYRDQTELRILNGVTDGTTPVLADALTASIPCASSTAFEYPVIADTDGDGSANICVTCSYGYNTDPRNLRTYESAGRPWSSTRTVWNQVNYEPLYINEDLTVPKYPIPKNMAFNGKYPYNGALIQVPTMVDGNFNIVQVAPDPAVDSVWFEQYGVDSVRIYLRVKNLSAKRNVNQNLPVALYNAAVSADTTGAVAGGANYILSKPLGETILPGDVHTMYFNIIKTKMSNQMSVRIQDDGAKYPASGSFLDCDYSNNVGVFGNLLAFDDRATGTVNTPLNIDVLGNDLLGACTSSSITIDTIANKGPKHGSLTTKADKSFDYEPNLAFTGIDSLDYYIKCGSDSSAARVYIAVLKQSSLNYVACPNASITMSMTAIAGVTYYWYNARTGSVVVTGGSNTNSLTVVKGSATDIGTWWVEARYGAIKFPRHKVELLLADNCGTENPAGCAATGTVIWKEDFDHYDDGLNPASNVRSTEQLPAGMTTYAFGVPGQTGGVYSLLKRGLYGWEAERAKDDHTSPNNNTIGRLLLVNGKETPDRVYRQDIPGVCDNTTLYFSFWAGGCDAQLRLTIYSADDNSVLSICEFPSLPDGPSQIVWKHYGFIFRIPDGIGSVYFDFYNHWGALGGNDFAIDDIEVRLCAPPVTAAEVNGKATDTVCAGSPVVLTVDPYEDNGIFAAPGDNLKGYWQRSFTGDINTPSDWTPLSGSDATGPAPLSVPAFTDYPPLNDTVYYRFVISSVANADKPNCRAASATLPVVVREQTPKYPDIRLQLCASPARPIYLSAYLDTLYLKSVVWSKISGPDFVPGTANSTGELNSGDFSLGTHIYRYKIQNECATDSARVYIRNTANPLVSVSLSDTVVVCHSIPSAARLQLNRMMGLETDGNWNYHPDLNPFVTETVSPSKFAGAYVFDATAAWNALKSNPTYKITYNGDVDATAFTFTYTTGSQTCFGNKTKKLVLIVTSKPFFN